ncbi:HAD family hydrolase [Mesobacillus foraminis]|uniref:Cof subfamily protein (Haloacid dehalogenase superfamily)/HAD superfamily hydrolase (TIGR01484 family) n=1 Tax=Mesobacillus foraminis TaxID=279826 RepID=A0A4R2BGU3_9BACI|nr:HAD family hydrolase [Mesobacillus foraminis]TCN26086.1 hypothetical protein EV146_104193 [Mesobacillus foraminis]
MRFPLLAIDLDGTLFNDHKEIDPVNIHAIHRYRELGGKVVICSGRSPLSTKWVAETIGLCEPIIAYNGSIILDENGEIIETSNFQQGTLISFLDSCQTRGIYAHFYEGDTLLIPEENEWNDKWIENNIPLLAHSGGTLEGCNRYRSQCQVKLIDDLFQYISENMPKISKIAVFDKAHDLREFSHQLASKHEMEISSSFNYANLEISPAGVSKGTSLLRLADLLKIPLSRVAAIGDNYNDVQMLKTAGLGIAMGNAPSEVKAQADTVTNDNNAGGIAAAINEYLF